MATNDETTILKAAYPRWHSILFVILAASILIPSLPSMDKLDEAARIETFTRRRFPEFMDITTMAVIRMLIAMSIWSLTIYLALISKGWILRSSYLKGSKLKMVPVVMSGAKTMAPFTSVSWILLGVSFTLSSFIAMKGANNESVAPWILRTALCVWEVAAPNSLLVSSVIRYAIWPTNLARGSPTAPLKSVRYGFVPLL